MPISDAEGYDKGHFTRVYEHLIKPAVIEAGFEPVRADDTSKANFIVMDILQQILACDMAICDLSSRNPNVFYLNWELDNPLISAQFLYVTRILLSHLIHLALEL